MCYTSRLEVIHLVSDGFLWEAAAFLRSKVPRYIYIPLERLLGNNTLEVASCKRLMVGMLWCPINIYLGKPRRRRSVCDVEAGTHTEYTSGNSAFNYCREQMVEPTGGRSAGADHR